MIDGWDGDSPILRAPRVRATVRHLATHTSGIEYEFWSADTAKYLQQTGQPTILSGLEAALAYPLTSDPGTRWGYGISIDWLGRVEISADRIDDRPTAFSGGMQQRLQIARNLVTGPRLVFMDEPTGGLDVSVQARLLDLLRGLVREMGLSAIIVTHDLAVVRLLADRLMVMKDGHVIESGLTDQVLDDPQHAYTQLLVSSVLQV